MSGERSQPQRDSRMDRVLDALMIGALVVMLGTIAFGLLVMH